MAGDSSSPLFQHQCLRAALRAARQGVELSREDVAASMGWPLSKVIRIEIATTPISVDDLTALLRHYGIVDTDRISELIALAESVRNRSWWSVYRDVAPAGLLELIAYESAAGIARAFEPLLVPGLLQTEEYARVTLGQFMDGLSTEGVESLVQLRMKRQELLYRVNPPSFVFLMDEAVIHRLAGGGMVMQRQLRHLANMAGRSNITIRIVPFSAGIHPGLKGPFVTLEFFDPMYDDVIYLEGPEGHGSISIDAPEQVLAYREAFELLHEISLHPDESITYLSRMADRIR